jgi:hypothetical protein
MLTRAVMQAQQDQTNSETKKFSHWVKIGSGLLVSYGLTGRRSFS